MAALAAGRREVLVCGGPVRNRKDMRPVRNRKDMDAVAKPRHDGMTA